MLALKDTIFFKNPKNKIFRHFGSLLLVLLALKTLSMESQRITHQ